MNFQELFLKFFLKLPITLIFIFLYIYIYEYDFLINLIRGLEQIIFLLSNHSLYSPFSFYSKFLWWYVYYYNLLILFINDCFYYIIYLAYVQLEVFFFMLNVSIDLMQKNLQTIPYTNFIFFYLLEWVVLVTSIMFVNYLGVKGFFLMNIFNSIIFSVCLLLLFYKININQDYLLINFGEFFKLSVNSTIGVSFLLDSVSYNFCLLTTLISVCVYFYTYSYMRNEMNIINFFFFLKTFVLSMILLLLANNWVSLILGWELIGLTSFLLINFWSFKIATLKSAFKAFTFNKLSDCSLIICFLLLQYFNNSFFFNINISNSIYLFKNIYFLNHYISFSEILLFFLIITAFCKSAQFGFHFWLPDSMEAPVPASALIHSATLVSAGIYLILRYNYLFIYSSFCSNFFLITCSFTAFFGALVSSFQSDLKKILAYSTISHCGFLMVSLYLSNNYITLLYLYGHGFYKSLSFMCVGNLIQSSFNYQDYRKMGNFQKIYVFEFFFLFICIFNLSGFPFFLNFFIKHFLLNNIYGNNLIKFFCIIFIYCGAFAGIFYGLKLFYYSFITFKKSHHHNYKIFFIKNVEKKNFFPIKVGNDKYKSEKQFINVVNYVAKSNNMGMYSMIVLFIINIFIFNNLLLIFNDNITIFTENNIFFKNIIFNNNNYTSIKILYLYIFIVLLFFFIFFKKSNIFEMQYLWVYFIILLSYYII